MRMMNSESLERKGALALGTGAISGILCRCQTSYCLQVNDGERTLPPAALNAQNVHPGITNGPQGWILLPIFAALMNSSHYFLFNPCIILRILVVEVTIVRLSSTFHLL